MENKAPSGRRVVIYECTGQQERPTVADYLAEKGKEVILVTHFPSINQHWGLKSLGNGTNLPVIWGRFKKHGVSIIPMNTLNRINFKSVDIADVITGEERTLDEIDCVGLATGYRSNNKLFTALKGKLKNVIAIGDCELPGRCLDAIHEGYLTALYL